MDYTSSDDPVVKVATRRSKFPTSTSYRNPEPKTKKSKKATNIHLLGMIARGER